MRRKWLAGLLGACMFFGCGTPHVAEEELADLYLGTLEDKHFVWCTLDVDQCRKDYLEWTQTEQGRTIISEYEKEQSGQMYHTHEIPDVIESDDARVSPSRYGPNVYPPNGKVTPTHTNAVR